VGGRWAAAARRQAEAATADTLRRLTVHPVVLDGLARRPPGEQSQGFIREVPHLWGQVAAAESDAGRELRADGAFQVGWLHQNLGDPLAAAAAYEAAPKVRAELAAGRPTDPGRRDRLAVTHSRLADVQMGGDPPAAAANYRAARAIQERLADEFPAAAVYRAELAHTLASLAATPGVADHEQAAALWAALGLRVRLAAEVPAQPDYRLQLAGSQAQLGWRLAAADPAEAERLVRAAVATCELLVAAHPGRRDFRGTSADVGSQLGRLVAATGRATEGAKLFRQSLADLDALAAEFPGVGTYRRRAEAVRGWLADLRAVAGDPPDDARPAVRVDRAVWLARTGRAEAAVGEAGELTRRGDWKADEWLKLAGVFGAASEAVPARRPEHADRAMGLLRRAVAAGLSDPQAVASHPGLAPLRDRLDYRWLAAKLAGRGRGGPPP
jgi:hypothetical protein